MTAGSRRQLTSQRANRNMTLTYVRNVALFLIYHPTSLNPPKGKKKKKKLPQTFDQCSTIYVLYTYLFKNRITLFKITLTSD